MESVETTPVSTETQPSQEVAQGATQIGTGDQPPEPKKVKGKVYGKEIEIDEDTLRKNWQKYEAADEKFRQAAELEKKYSKYVDLDKAFQSKDLSVLSKYVDPETIRQFSEKQLLDWLEYQGLSDEQKEHLETKKKLNELEERQKAEKEEQESRQREVLNTQALKLIDDEIAGTFQEIGQKPTPAIIMRMAMHMDAGLSQDPPVFVSGKEAYRRAKKDLDSDIGGYLNSIDPKQLTSILPKQVIDAIRQQSVEEATQAFARRPRESATQEQKSQGKIRATTDDFFKQLDQKYQRR